MRKREQPSLGSPPSDCPTDGKNEFAQNRPFSTLDRKLFHSMNSSSTAAHTVKLVVYMLRPLFDVMILSKGFINLINRHLQTLHLLPEATSQMVLQISSVEKFAAC